MKNILKPISLILALVMLVAIACSCSEREHIAAGDRPYITVDGKELDREYIGYFFYLAKRNMIKEAGMILGDGGNSTQADVDAFWATTEIEGKSAVDVARDIASDNAVIQTVQYLKAVSEGIKITADDEKEISVQIDNAILSKGSQEAFNRQLAEMDCDANAYRQILTENMYVQKLYDKYDFDGKLSVSDEELALFVQANEQQIPPEAMFDSAKKDKFNKMAQSWKKEFDIKIDDEMMKKFTVK